MLRFKVIYDGVNLNDSIEGFTTTETTGRFVGGKDVTAKDNAFDGSYIVSKRVDSKTITVEFTVNAMTKVKLNDQMATLQRVLNTSEAKELRFTDEPDRCYKAICTALKIDKTYERGLTGTITFLVPDGLAHAVTSKSFKLTQDDGAYHFLVQNDGNVPVPVSFRMTIPEGAENGYIGLISDKSAMEFGDIEELDVTTKKKNVTLVNLTTGTQISNALTVGSGVMTENFAKNGTFKTVTNYGDNKSYLVMNTLGAYNSTSWYGACGMMSIPEDTTYPEQELLNWKLTFKLAYATHKRQRQTGMIQIVVGYQDDSGADKLMCDLHLVKSSQNNNNAKAMFKIDGATASSGDVLKQQYQPRSDNGPTKPNSNEIYIQKEGGKFTLCFGGRAYTYYVPSAANRIPKTITVALLDVKGRSETLYYMGVSSIKFEKINVSYEYDIPNRYQGGDVLDVNGKEGKFYVNGNAKMSDEVLGTSYIKAEPGTTEVVMSTSSFCPISQMVNKDDCVAYIEEAWL